MTWRWTHLAWLAVAAIMGTAGLAILVSSGVAGSGFDTVLRAGGINSVGGAQRSLVYRLDSVRPTQFTFSGERDLIQVLSSAAIRENTPAADPGWTYGYRLTFLDKTGSMIGQRDIHSLGLLAQMTDGVESVRFLRASNEQLANENEVFVKMPEGTAAVAMTALDADNDVVGIDVRVYERQPLTDAGAMVAFLRRSPEEQRRLTSGSAFPPDTLSDAEMRAVARNSWRPVGPTGIAGEAYQLVVVYEIEVEEEEAEVVAKP